MMSDIWTYPCHTSNNTVRRLSNYNTLNAWCYNELFPHPPKQHVIEGRGTCRNAKWWTVCVFFSHSHDFTSHYGREYWEVTYPCLSIQMHVYWLSYLYLFLLNPHCSLNLITIVSIFHGLLFLCQITMGTVNSLSQLFRWSDFRHHYWDIVSGGLVQFEKPLIKWRFVEH